MARGRNMDVRGRQLTFLPSEDEDADQAETLQSAREPDCDVQPLAGLPRHPYNAMLGDRTPDEMERMKEMLMRLSHTIQIWTLGGHVLSDWDEYCTAVEESLPTLIQEYIGEDPAAFACNEAFHGLGLNKSQSALRVVLAFPWAEQGRPKNPVESTGFSTNGLTPQTAAQMAKLANCRVPTISQARRIHTGGVEPHRPVQMRAGHTARRPHMSDDLTGGHHVAFADRHAGEVGKEGVETPPVVENHAIA